MVTEKPLACNKLANEAAMIPFPSEDVTPPVTKMYFVLDIRVLKCGPKLGVSAVVWKKYFQALYVMEGNVR